MNASHDATLSVRTRRRTARGRTAPAAPENAASCARVPLAPDEDREHRIGQRECDPLIEKRRRGIDPVQQTHEHGIDQRHGGAHHESRVQGHRPPSRNPQRARQGEQPRQRQRKVGAAEIFPRSAVWFAQPSRLRKCAGEPCRRRRRWRRRRSQSRSAWQFWLSHSRETRQASGSRVAPHLELHRRAC